MHLDSLLFILLVAIAALLRLLASKAGNAKGKSEQPPQRSTSTPRSEQPIPRAPVDSDEERIRRFLEALGQPTTSKPPPPVTPRTDIPPRPVAPVRPPSTIQPFIRPRRVIVPKGTTPAPVEVPKKTPVAIAPPTFEVQTASAESPKPLPIIAARAAAFTTALPRKITSDAKERNFAMLLRSSAGLRDAIVLREIFGPPRSLQPLDVIGSA
jgi:hypothetical protein